MDYFLQKVGGRPARQAVTLRRCTPAEAPAVFALQNEVRAAMPHPEQFVPDTLENITGYLRTGVCIGAWQQGRLGAYLILRLCGQSDENYAAFMGIPREVSGSTGPTQTAQSSTRTGGATACSGSCWKRRCPGSAPASWASGPPSARRINTA